jgi:YjbE family integral membrane protein
MNWAPAFDFFSIIWLDVVLSGDNALIIGLAASSLSREQRRLAVIFGLAAAAVIRILFASITTYLMGMPGILFAGGMALLWVSHRLYREIRADIAHEARSAGDWKSPGSQPRRSLLSALIAITVADISMSIDNVLAVAAIARENVTLLVFGLSLSIALMGLCATLILQLLVRFRWISYVGVLFLVYVACDMIWDGRGDVVRLVAMLGALMP